MCFVKDEHVLSISEYANIKKSLFDNPPYNKLKKRSDPPKGLQLRKKDGGRYPYHLEYSLKEDKNIVFQLCKKACENYHR